MRFKKIFSWFYKKISNKEITSEEIFNEKNYRDYFFGDYRIQLSNNHVLDIYQEKFPLYDKFLPNFCANLENLIIDVGANIGDTSIAIFSKNNKSQIVGIEPDECFFNECIINIQNNNLSDRFIGINKFLSSDKGNFSIKISDSNSTGYRVEDTSFDVLNKTNTITFEELMNIIPNSKSRGFDLLKIDTDGFDWDVLLSFVDYARNNSLIPKYIFFEMQTFLNNDEYNINGRIELIDKYNKSLNEISKLGFNNFCLIDNFGTFFKKANSVNEIFELNNYIKRSQINNKNSTIFYFDVLAYNNSENENVDAFFKKNYL